MALTKKIYRRLPGKGLAAFQHVRLFQGPDHLLQIASSGYSEGYKRFYFRDIQSISVHKTHIGKIWNGAFGFALAMFAMPAFGLGGGAAIAMWCITGFFALFLLGNLLLWPSCACYVRTAVQTERLSAVSRIWTVRRLLRRIRPLIEWGQGFLPRDEVAARLHGRGVPTAHVADAPPAITQPAPAAATERSEETSPGV